ncbi:hypothetical protein [Natronolimnobius baerhuensis]|uniref:Uncharacterized protein n=1 Tax=Natronolimnobius baerhuensis TaxID=253108 RepID=A0A202E8Y7_9EURY|nr:hypothetical protein [Natronolimnobius baerhuensis]OVE84430.1 hypothetical protein B2G88_08450 [Natronolimnobius baerhuensis]
MATKQYELLTASPQTNIHRGRLAPRERAELRHLKVEIQNSLIQGTGGFTTVYYLEGDIRQAAKVFVNENRETLESINFTKNTVFQSSLPREAFDWVLHFLGKRRLRKYQTVVVEQRAEATQWIIDREHFDRNPNRRYSISEYSARVSNLKLEELYTDFGSLIHRSELNDHNSVSGDERLILEYYCIAGPFDCDLKLIDDELAIRKYI